MPQTKLWTRTFIVLMGINFCSALSFYLIMVKTTEFSIDTYHVPLSVASSTITVYVIAALFTRLFFGGKIDSWGVKRSLAIGTCVNALCMALYLIPMGFAPLMVVRIVHGFSFALMSGSAAAGAALVIPAKHYGEGIGYFSMMQALATGIGPFVAILFTNISGGYFHMFAFAAVFAILAVFGLFLLDIPQVAQVAQASETSETSETSDGKDPSLNFVADNGSGDTVGESTQPRDLDVSDESGARKKTRGIGSLIELSVLHLGVVLFLCYVGYAGILSYITLYAGELGLSGEVTLFFVVYAAIILISRPPVGRRVDRKGENSVIYWCFLSLMVGFIVLAFVLNGAVLLAAAAFIGFGIGATQSITQAVIARDTPKDEMGKANSTFFMSMDLGSGLGPIILGAIIPFIGYHGCYLLLAGVAVCAGVVYHITHGSHVRNV